MACNITNMQPISSSTASLTRGAQQIILAPGLSWLPVWRIYACTWKLKHLLKINVAKTELMLFVKPPAGETISEKPTVILADCVVHATKAVCNIGVLQDSHLDGNTHTSSIVRSSNFHLYQLARTFTCINSHECVATDSYEACRLAAPALVVSTLDYCNVLIAGSSQHQLEKLPRLQNRAARLVAYPHNPPGGVVHVTPIMQRLLWLPVRQRVIYKVCVLVHHCVHGVGLSYTCQNCYSITSGTAASADFLQRSSDNTRPDRELGE